MSIRTKPFDINIIKRRKLNDNTYEKIEHQLNQENKNIQPNDNISKVNFVDICFVSSRPANLSSIRKRTYQEVQSEDVIDTRPDYELPKQQQKPPVQSQDDEKIENEGDNQNQQSHCLLIYAHEPKSRFLLPQSILRPPIENAPSQHLEVGLLQVDIHNWGDVWLTCCTSDSISVRLHVTDFQPYFYARVPPSWSESELDQLRRKLNLTKWNKPCNRVASLRFEERVRLFGFTNGTKDRLIRVTLYPGQNMVNVAKQFNPVNGADRIQINGVPVRLETFQHKWDLKTLFLFEAKIHLQRWLKISRIHWLHRPGSEYIRKTTCQLEGAISMTDIQYLPDKRDVIPFQFVVVDIETVSGKAQGMGIRKVKPYAKPTNPDDPAFMVSVVHHTNGKPEPNFRMIMMLKDSLPIQNADQIWMFETEEELLKSLRDDVLLPTDPDAIVGFNTKRYDIPYLLTRAIDVYHIPGWSYLGRFKDQDVKLSPKNRHAKAPRLYNDVRIDGRVQFDVYQIVLQREKMSPYTLKNSCKELLRKEHQQKAKMDLTDVMGPEFKGSGYDLIPPFYYEGDAYTRSLLAEYCILDSLSCLQIMIDKLYFTDFAEQAKLTNTDMDDLISRGQQIRVYNKICEKVHSDGWYENLQELIDWMFKTFGDLSKSEKGEDKYRGGCVLNAKKGYYSRETMTVQDSETGQVFTEEMPIVITILDFASLYPSIMMALNLCYSTIVIDPQYLNIDGIKYEKHKGANMEFVVASNARSVLPEILRELVDARSQVKKLMKQAEKEGNVFMENLYNKMQSAIKITCNATYGFTGAKKGMLPCRPIAAIVCETGQSLILKSKEYAETKVPDAYTECVYGDTDSIMVKMIPKQYKRCLENKVEDQHRFMEKVFEISKRLADEITAMIGRPPIKLEHEKCAKDYMLFSKKQYAYEHYDKPRQHMDKIQMKGIAAIKRDWCTLTQNTAKDILQAILREHNVPKAIELWVNCVDRLCTDKVPMEQLVLTKRLSGAYKEKTKKGQGKSEVVPPHKHVADQIEARDPSRKVEEGTRVSFYITKKGPQVPFYKQAEDAEWVERFHIPLDIEYYLDKQLIRPMMQILEMVQTPAQLKPLLERLRTQTKAAKFNLTSLSSS